MAAALGALLLLLHTCSASALRPGPVAPHLTSCVSSNMETFHCRWTVGTFQNLSEPGALRLFYFNRIPPTPFQKNWRECPHYSVETPNECFFSENYTTIWTSYTVRLQSGDRTVLYDEASFDVTDIVQPDPPVGLSYTVLNSSLTGSHFDIMARWNPPSSADVETGWMALLYEVQYRSADSDRWQTTDPIKSTQRSLFGLQTDVNHEVRVRCKMLGGKFFGEFSDSVFVHVPAKVSRFPVLALLIFGALCLVAVLMSVIISQQEKLMFLLLPPVPGPKIRGIDSDLLKKGKLRELTSILGGPPDLRPELYNNDPWVEFIDLDIEEQSDKLTDLDMDCLVDRSSCSPPFRDDDSGRSSCCEPELLSESGPSPVHRLDPNQTLGKEPPCQKPSDSSSGGREAVYTMVSEVRASGSVLLSPEEQTETDRNKDIMVGKDKAEQADHRDYTSELHAGKMSPELSKDNLREPFQTGPDPSPALSNMSLSPLPPAPAYTVVDGVDRQNSLLLTLNSAAAPCLTIPKAAPTPDGYLTPELLGSITP
ncbi:growth hormone receptor b isoform X1 [Kryptolebias marmoratus]|uniref:Growth hormone receptor II n=2 Tax=Kryptolebias marmoratus TaxID=37003 RepID=H6TXS0_KRYMA|nr:growth hormone receptor b precursor [Kryptolebias marmoratus]XP_017296506.1 growth hormone receptor b isoform X1 [Kryptolebias marmoratus]AER10850.1 growth hormone receptor II [Kryptolebias marmoratus]